MRLVSVLAVAFLGLVIVVTATSAAGPYPAGGRGYDVSFPQCGMELPALPYAFGIVGVTGGFAFTENPCLKEQYAWAAKSGHASVYINMKSPAGETIDERDHGPAGDCTKDDTRCQAYNYGYKTAQHAFEYAAKQGVVNPATWWLDIETESTWSDDTTMNAVVIRAAIDFFETKRAVVGIYSTAYQWSLIAGEYRPGLPNWVGGGSDLADARKLCATGAFGGGEVQLVQYLGPTFAHDYACTDADITATPTPTPPVTATATTESALTGGSIPIEGGFGLAVFSGGSIDALVTATACPRTTAVFYFTVDGAFVLYIPGSAVASVNAPFLASFEEGMLPENTAFLGKCV